MRFFAIKAIDGATVYINVEKISMICSSKGSAQAKVNENVGKIFGLASEKMESIPAEEAWDKAIYETSNNLLEKDKEILKELGKLLGQTDIEGQISQIKLVSDFLDMQIEEANMEKLKNEKLYRTLRNGSRTCYCNCISIVNKNKRKVQNGY